MNIEEFKNEKYKFECELCELLNSRLKSFVEKTGMVPDSINVRLHRHQIIGNKYSHVIVAGVSVDISL